MIHRACYVACDDCHTPAEISTRGAREAREYARRQGFVRVRRSGRYVDLCPAHASVKADRRTA